MTAKKDQNPDNIQKIQKIQKIHFIGIFGSGMLPLAQIALASGYEVSGSDLSFSHHSDKLKKQGATLYQGHSKEHIKAPLDAVIYSTAVQKDNVELLEAKGQNIPLLHRSDLLQLFMKERLAVTIAGSHGKTTTTALTHHMLTVLGQEPSSYIGAKTLPSGQAGFHGKGDVFLAEADESDGSFLTYTPYISTLTGIAPDHLDFYQTFDHVKEAFKKYLLNTKEDGMAILFWDDEHIRQLAEGYEGRFLSYGTKIGCDIRLLSSHVDGKSISFKAMVERDLVAGTIPMPGAHNALNALAALGVARALDLDVQKACKSFASFCGVDRRLNLLYESSSKRTLLYDDYAHNPEKITTSLKALRESWKEHKIHVIFQPHRHSRMETRYNEMVSSFSHSDIVYNLPVYSAGEVPKKAITDEEIAASIRKMSHVAAVPCGSFSSVEKTLRENWGAKNLVVTLGAGDVNKVAYDLKTAFRAKESQEK